MAHADNHALMEELYKIKNERLALQRVVNELEEREKNLTYELTNLMVEGNMAKYQAAGFTLVLNTKDTALATDWPTILDYIKSTGSVDLLQKRLTESAVKARWNSGVDVPGVVHSPKHVITLTKD